MNKISTGQGGVLIAEIEASFANGKKNLSFNVHDQTGFINLITSADQLSEVAKLLLLAGNGKTFKVKFYEQEERKIEEKSGGQASDVQDGGGTAKENQRIF